MAGHELDTAYRAMVTRDAAGEKVVTEPPSA